MATVAGETHLVTSVAHEENHVARKLLDDPESKNEWYSTLRATLLPHPHCLLLQVGLRLLVKDGRLMESVLSAQIGHDRVRSSEEILGHAAVPITSQAPEQLGSNVLVFKSNMEQ